MRRNNSGLFTSRSMSMIAVLFLVAASVVLGMAERSASAAETTTIRASNEGPGIVLPSRDSIRPSESAFGVQGALMPQAATDQTYPSIAFDGTGYFVVWQDSRNGAYTDIYGARVTPSGALLDSSGIAIATASDHQSLPAVAFDGENFLVVWEDYRSSSYCDVYGARVTKSGVLLEPGGIPISTAAYYQRYPAVAFDGTNYMVAWADFRDWSYDLYVARVSKAGVVLDPAGIPVSTATGDQSSPAIAFDGTNYMVVWADERNGTYTDLYGARVSTSGTVLDPDGIAISTAANHQDAPAIAFDGTNYMVAWYDEHAGSYYDVYGARVSTAGTVLDPTGIPISTAPNYQGYPAIVFDGIDYVVVWQDFRSGTYDVYGSRVTTSGAVLDPGGIAISTAVSYQGFPTIAFDGTNCMVAWQDSRGGSYDIYAARLDRTGVVLDPAGFTDLAFASASAAVRNGCVDLSWRMTADVPGSSFLVRRSESPNGEFLTLDVPVLKGPELSFSCIDCGVASGRTYWYILVLIGQAGEESYGPVEVHVEAAPVAYRLYQSYPNPFNPSCTIRFELPEAGKVSLRLFDVNGAAIRTLADGWREPGVYNEVWDGKGDGGSELPSGVYLCELRVNDIVAVQKTVLLK